MVANENLLCIISPQRSTVIRLTDSKEENHEIHLRIVLLKTNEWKLKRSICFATSRKLKNNVTLSGRTRKTCESAVMKRKRSEKW